ncbi:MAG: preprotein translocase subunit SecG [Planctomycetaceae bacterium]
MSFLIGTLSFVMVAISLFMILLVLIQRGRGGGLAGAFGGMGGQSAFGTRAGDMFTRITIVLAVVWVSLAGGLGMLMRRDAEAAKKGEDKGGFEQGGEAGKTDDADKNMEDGAKLDGAAETKADVKSKAEEAAPSDAKTPRDADAEKSEAKTPDVEKSDAGEAEKSTPAEKTDAAAEKTEAPVEAEPAKEVPADAATPGVETPATEPNP